MVEVLGPRAGRVLEQGVGAGRFDIPSLALAVTVTFGSLLSTPTLLERPDADEEELASLHAEAMLRMVGLGAAEAQEVSRRPLPELPS